MDSIFTDGRPRKRYFQDLSQVDMRVTILETVERIRHF